MLVRCGGMCRFERVLDMCWSLHAPQMSMRVCVRVLRVCVLGVDVRGVQGVHVGV